MGHRPELPIKLKRRLKPLSPMDFWWIIPVYQMGKQYYAKMDSKYHWGELENSENWLLIFI